MIEPKQTAPEVPGLIFHAGNLAVLCIRGGRLDYAITLSTFQRIQWKVPMEVGDPLIQSVQAELDDIRKRLVTFLVETPNNVRN